MTKRESQLIVRAVLAGMTKQYSVADIRSTSPVRDFGIGDRQVTRFKQRLLLALSGEPRPDSRRFSAALLMTSNSTVAAVAGQLTKAYEQSLPTEGRRKHSQKFRDVRKGDADIAVRTALGQSSRKYSALHITPTMDLGDLGLNQAAINKARTAIFNVFAGSKSRIKFADFARAIPARKSLKVEDLVHTSIDTFSLPDSGMIRSLSGEIIKGPRGFREEQDMSLPGGRTKGPHGYAGQTMSLSGDRTKGSHG